MQVAQSYGRDPSQLVSDLWDDKHNGVDSEIGMKVKDLEADQFELSVQTRMWGSWTDCSIDLVSESLDSIEPCAFVFILSHY